MHVDKVLSTLQEKQWRIKLSKCSFEQQQIAYLGHIISDKGVSTDPSKMLAVQNWPTPANVKEIRGFLSLTRYYRKFIKNYVMISRPLTELLKKGTLFVWTLAAETAFITLKVALVQAPVDGVLD